MVRKVIEGGWLVGGHEEILFIDEEMNRKIF